MALYDLVTVFAETKSVTKWRLHCTSFHLKGGCRTEIFPEPKIQLITVSPIYNVGTSAGFLAVQWKYSLQFFLSQIFSIVCIYLQHGSPNTK